MNKMEKVYFKPWTPVGLVHGELQIYELGGHILIEKVENKNLDKKRMLYFKLRFRR